MKVYLIFFFLILSSSLSAKDLTVTVIEGWKSQPVPNAQVTLRSNVGRLLEKTQTDSTGKVYFKDLTYGFHSVEVESTVDFNGKSYRFKLQKSTEITVMLMPSHNSLKLQWRMVDEKYDSINAKLKSETAKNTDSLTFTTNDTLTSDATFPGGKHGMNQFLKKYANYPEISRELGDQGGVYIECIIERDGKVTHVKVIRGISPELDFEAQRLVRSMPKWNPQITKGKHQRVKCRFPVYFTLQ